MRKDRETQLTTDKVNANSSTTHSYMRKDRETQLTTDKVNANSSTTHEKGLRNTIDNR